MSTENIQNSEEVQENIDQTQVDPGTEDRQEHTGAEEQNQQQNPDDKPGDDDWKKSDVFTDMEKMSHGFRKRIEKLNQKHADEMKAMEDKYEARLKALEERTAAKPEVKGRDAFEKDEDYIDYLVKKGIDEDRANQKRQSDEQAAKDAEAEKARKDAEADVQRRQEIFRKNTEDSFDTEGRNRFRGQLQYAIEHGFGDVLDANPAASDYILGNRMGPRVLDHLLNNPEEFKSVFVNEGQTQMEQFWQLKQIEAKVLAEGRGESEEQTPKAKFNLGKPGGQGAQSRGSTRDDDPIARRDYLRKLGVC